MYRIISIVIVIIIFTGCNKIERDVSSDIYENSDISVLSTEDNDSMDVDDIIKRDLTHLVHNNDYISDDSLLVTYMDILTSKVSFCNSDFDEKVFLNGINYDDYSLTPLSYSLIDMNKDNISELVLETLIGAMEFILVLHVNEGEIRSHMFSHRQMGDIKMDGSFFSSGGAGYYCINELAFADDGYIMNQLGCHEAGSEFDEEGNVVISYYLNQKKVNEIDFKSYLNDFEEKEDAIWCEFPKAN